MAEGVMALMLLMKRVGSAQYLGLMQVTDVRNVVVPSAWLEETPARVRTLRARVRVVSFMMRWVGSS